LGHPHEQFIGEYRTQPREMMAHGRLANADPLGSARDVPFRKKGVEYDQ
jgi:pimeloyl-ACP methyl ester carboxylesterase